MSYGIMAYPTDTGIIRKWVGSGDAKLAESLAGYLSRSLDQLDDDLWRDDDALPARTAFKQLITDTELDPDEGPLYAYCLKLLCWYSTDHDMLPNRHWSAMRFSWFDTVGAELRAQNVAFDPTDLIYGGPPVPLPRIDDFPTIGHVANAEMPAMVETLNAFDPTKADPEVAAAVKEMHSWLTDCHSYGTDLVCYYH